MTVEDRNDLVMVICIAAILLALIFALAPDGSAQVEPTSPVPVAAGDGSQPRGELIPQPPTDQFRGAVVPLPATVPWVDHSAWPYWSAAGVLAGSVVLDGVTTVHVIECGGTETGSRWLYGARPGPGAFARGVILWEIPKVILGYRFRHSPHWYLRYPGAVLMSYDAVEHFRGSAHNLQQRCR